MVWPQPSLVRQQQPFLQNPATRAIIFAGVRAHRARLQFVFQQFALGQVVLELADRNSWDTERFHIEAVASANEVS